MLGKGEWKSEKVNGSLTDDMGRFKEISEKWDHSSWGEARWTICGSNHINSQFLGGNHLSLPGETKYEIKSQLEPNFCGALSLSAFWIADTDVHSELILEPFFPRANGCVLFFSAIFPHRLPLVGRWPLDIRQPTTEEAERARKVAIQALNCTANILGISIVLQTFLELSVVQKIFSGLYCTENIFKTLSCAANIFWALCCKHLMLIQLFSVFKTSQFKRCLLMPRTRPQGWHEGNPTMAHPEILQIRKTNPVNHRSN